MLSYASNFIDGLISIVDNPHAYGRNIPAAASQSTNHAAQTTIPTTSSQGGISRSKSSRIRRFCAAFFSRYSSSKR